MRKICERDVEEFWADVVFILVLLAIAGIMIGGFIYMIIAEAWMALAVIAVGAVGALLFWIADNLNRWIVQFWNKYIATEEENGEET